MQLTVPSDTAKKFAPWSLSKLNALEACPQKFAHSYILKSPKEVVGEQSRTGLVIHSVLENRLKNVTYERAVELVTIKEKLDAKEVAELQDHKTAVEKFIDRAQAYAKNRQVSKWFVEKQLGITETGEKTGFWDKNCFFRAGIDFAMVYQNAQAQDELFICDHKSGKVPDVQYRQKKYEFQLNIGTMLCTTLVPTIQKVKRRIHFFKAENEDPIWPLEDNDFDRLVFLDYLIRRVNSACVDLVEPYAARPARPFPCGWCEYKNRCDAYKEEFE